MPSWIPHTMFFGSASSIFLGYGRLRLAMISTNSSLVFPEPSLGLSAFSSPTVLHLWPL